MSSKQHVWVFATLGGSKPGFSKFYFCMLVFDLGGSASKYHLNVMSITSFLCWSKQLWSKACVDLQF